MLEDLRACARGLRFSGVSEVRYFSPPKMKAALQAVFSPAPRQDDPWYWALIQSRQLVKIAEYGYAQALPLEGYLLRTWPGRGCEAANFGFCRYPARAEMDGREYPSRLSQGWRWHSFCKTQFSAGFQEHHLRVIALLDRLERYGFRMEVDDEGGYWRGRDITHLAASLARFDPPAGAFAENMAAFVPPVESPEIGAFIDSLEASLGASRPNPVEPAGPEE